METCGGITSGDTPLKRGRYPWFEVDGTSRQPYMIGIGGGSASGKTTVANFIIEKVGVPWVVLLQMDSFYKSLTQEQKDEAFANNYNFDHPSAFDFDILFRTLSDLKAGIKVDVPQYSFSKHSREEATTTIYGANIVIFEGIFALYDPKVRALMDLMVFVDADSDVRLARRLQRDISERGRSVHGVIAQYTKFVKPAFDDFIAPTMKHADVIVPNGTAENSAAFDILVKHITRELEARDLPLRSRLASMNYPQRLPASTVVLEKALEVENIIKSLVRRDISAEEFECSVDRLSRLVVERGLAEFETIAGSVDRNIDISDFHAKLCGIIVTRSRGPTMLTGMNQVIRNLQTGTVMLVQPIRTATGTSADNILTETELHHYTLPADISSRIALVTDVTTATGAAALMAIRVVLDHGVAECNVVFLTLMATTGALHAVANAFPGILVVVGAVVESAAQLDEVALFGDRSFGAVAQD
ncbi:Uridine-cytidine kinase-like 1 [Entophlyctis luteolus]|nr:Uridine-cytidine kinase-like 1 [Entophlyctis luteolus]